MGLRFILITYLSASSPTVNTKETKTTDATAGFEK